MYILVFIIDEAQEAEAVQVLNSIYDMREQQADTKPESRVAIAHALAMLYCILREKERVGDNWQDPVPRGKLDGLVQDCSNSSAQAVLHSAIKLTVA